MNINIKQIKKRFSLNTVINGRGLNKLIMRLTALTLLVFSTMSLANNVVDEVKATVQAIEEKAQSVIDEMTQEVKKVSVDENSFSCIREMTPVRHFYVDNLLGNIDETLAAANAPEGAKYPVGSVVQLVPTEAMVKREKGTSPATADWEFFELIVDDEGTKINKRGFVDVNNRFDGNCFACHAPAREPWDFICESDHGCEPIPIDRKMTGALQRTDPRCEADATEDGDSMALFKLKAMVMVGSTVKWFKDLGN